MQSVQRYLCRRISQSSPRSTCFRVPSFWSECNVCRMRWWCFTYDRQFRFISSMAGHEQWIHYFSVLYCRCWSWKFERYCNWWSSGQWYILYQLYQSIESPDSSFDGDGSYCRSAVVGNHYFSKQQGKMAKTTVDASGQVTAYRRIDPIGAEDYQFINPFVLIRITTISCISVRWKFIWRRWLSGIPTQ